MNPDDVVGLEQRQQLSRKQAVNAQVTFVFTPVEAEVSEQVVAHGPQGRVAETVVVQLVRPFVQVDGGVSDLAALLELGVAWFAGRRPAVPAEPDPAELLQRRQHSDRQAAGGFHVAGRPGDAIRYCDESRHNASSHEILRRRAALMMPTML